LAFFIWHAAKEQPAISQVREPRVSIRDENLESVIVAELPGVSEEEIRVNVEEGFIVSLETTGARKYATTVPLSENVNAASLRKTYHNGLLELRLQKA
jgi:HSP20 family protein